MKTYETSATVEAQGQVRVAGVPFAPGTEVEVTISPKRSSAEEFAAAWARLCAELRDRPDIKELSETEVDEQIQRYRTGR